MVQLQKYLVVEILSFITEDMLSFCQTMWQLSKKHRKIIQDNAYKSIKQPLLCFDAIQFYKFDQNMNTMFIKYMKYIHVQKVQNVADLSRLLEIHQQGPQGPQVFISIIEINTWKPEIGRVVEACIQEGIKIFRITNTDIPLRHDKLYSIKLDPPFIKFSGQPIVGMINYQRWQAIILPITQAKDIPQSFWENSITGQTITIANNHCQCSLKKII